MSYKIYLAGSMSGVSDEEGKSWRQYVKDCFADLDYVKIVDPYDIAERLKPENFDSLTDVENKSYEFACMNEDLLQVKTSDLVLIRLDNSKSLGTMAELATCYERGIRTLAFPSEDTSLEHQHPWIYHMIRMYSDNIDSAIECAKGFCTYEKGGRRWQIR